MDRPPLARPIRSLTRVDNRKSDMNLHDHTKQRIEEIKAEFKMFVPEDDGSAMDWLENTLEEAKKAGIDEAVKLVYLGTGEWLMEREALGERTTVADVMNHLKALQDNK